MRREKQQSLSLQILGIVVEEEPADHAHHKTSSS